MAIRLLGCTESRGYLARCQTRAWKVEPKSTSTTAIAPTPFAIAAGRFYPRPTDLVGDKPNDWVELAKEILFTVHVETGEVRGKIPLSPLRRAIHESLMRRPNKRRIT